MITQPDLVCNECGIKAAKKQGTDILQISTFHDGQCECCGQHKDVTERRDFGYPEMRHWSFLGGGGPMSGNGAE